MKINFDELDLQVLKNFQGGEKELLANMFVDDLNKILRGRVVKGASIGLHTHKTSSEIIFIVNGKAKFITDGVVEIVNQGECHYCKKGSSHTLINENEDDVVFFAVVANQ